jgi:hypothetical protein
MNTKHRAGFGFATSFSRRAGFSLRNPAGIFTLCFLLGLLLTGGCARKESGKLVARVGPRELSVEALADLAGRPVDSLSRAERRQLVDAWVERSLADLEGERRGLEKRPAIQQQLEMLRADLFASAMLAEAPLAPPTDREVQAYYDAHRQEFLRPVDAHLLELYWAEHENTMAQFRRQLEHGDTSMVAAGDVSAEGRWLAESGELDAQFEQELSSLKPGEVTFPRPYEDGYRVARLIESYPAGTVLDLSVVRDEIVGRLTAAQSRQRQDSLLTSWRERYPVTLLMGDSL